MVGLALVSTAAGQIPRLNVGTVTATIDGAPFSAAQVGAVVTGVHANEEFCKTLIKQVELDMKHQALVSDRTKRATYFADQKALNAALVKTAPAALASDIVLFTKNANAMIDARLAGDRAKDKAAIAALTSPEHLAAAKRANAYCGVKVTTSK